VEMTPFLVAVCLEYGEADLCENLEESIMQVEITNAAAAAQLAALAGCSVEQYVNQLIDQASDLEAIREGLEDVKEGRVTPVEEFDQAFRDESGFSSRPGK